MRESETATTSFVSELASCQSINGDPTGETITAASPNGFFGNSFGSVSPSTSNGMPMLTTVQTITGVVSSPGDLKQQPFVIDLTELDLDMDVEQAFLNIARKRKKI
ncbi:unnamed protein product [Sphenostylis stenocarpa]|uniref:Uncharacterized protein n=1 Tax=Sphenostylis stenocarpa TaxID=92480 RepID=A0AA86VFT8_9FABA|nr:unnamed protein product [Sphenostylis stenocarpa]